MKSDNGQTFKHPHWSFYAYDKIDKKTNGYIMPVEIEILDSPIESLALTEAKRKVKRKSYTLRKVWECNTCLFQEAQLKNQKETVELMKKQFE